ncbi:MAG: fibronectin type III domain-containing protein [Candidatus Nanopelagicales bacterium]|nr:fibronectin type III domain-containing protein [Candidatus Nanopelagicales bacterium]
MFNRRFSSATTARRLVGVASAAALGLGLLVAGPAAADQLPIDLADPGSAAVLLDGAAVSDYGGWAVADAGDVNSDGVGDVVVGAILADTANGANSGVTYVVFGGSSIDNVDLNDLGTSGFRILGAAAEDRSGYSVAGVGDVNGDGMDDVLIGSPMADTSGGVNSGAAYLVFGKDDEAAVDLAALGTGGLRVAGAAANNSTGWSVAAAGDVNDDATPDLLIGAQAASSNGKPASGSTYVVFGADGAGGLDLAALGSRGFRIDGAADYQRSGLAVAGPGDLNNDGKADLLIGAGYANKAYLVFGKDSTTTVDLASLGNGGFVMSSAFYDNSGWSVGGAGDVNDDGTADLLIGAPLAGENNRAASGSTFLVYGRSSTEPVDLGALGTDGIRIDGASGDDQSGYAVDGAGDVNQDGFADVLIGARKASSYGRISSGSSYVVYGNTSPNGLDLASLGSAGFRIDGAAMNDQSGSAVAGLGDVNDDGDVDLLVGAPEADNNSRSNSGASYLVVESPPVFTVPGAPTGVTGTPGDQQVQLSWTAPIDTGGADITGYRIEQSTGGGPWTEAVANTASTTTSHLITGLTNGTAHTFRVHAINAAGIGPASTPSTAVTPSGPVEPTPEPPVTPPATLTVTARPAQKGVPKTGKTRLVSRITPGAGQNTSISVKVAPKKAKKKTKVTSTSTSVTVLTKKATKGTITVSITASGAGVTGVTWTRTWKIR